MKKVFLIMILVSMLFLVKCKGSEEITPTPPIPPPTINYDGTWSGTTSQNRPITFTVLNNAITEISVETLASYGGASCVFSVGSKTLTPLSGNTFSIGIGGGTVSTTAKGTLTSAIAANGTIASYQLSGLICPGVFSMGTPITVSERTWAATKK